MKTELSPDPTKFRVNLLCTCNNDIAFGYGATIDEARDNAIKFFRRVHGRAKWREEIVEEAVTHDDQGSSHYEELYIVEVQP